jgi:hypothetical protein
MPAYIKRPSTELYLGEKSQWVHWREEAREFPSLAAAVEWCVQEDLTDFCFVLETGNSQLLLNPFDVDDEGKPRDQAAHVAKILLDNARLRREKQMLRGAMDAIYARAKERRKRTLPPFRKRECE